MRQRTRPPVRWSRSPRRCCHPSLRRKNRSRRPPPACGFLWELPLLPQCWSRKRSFRLPQRSVWGKSHTWQTGRQFHKCCFRFPSRCRRKPQGRWWYPSSLWRYLQCSQYLPRTWEPRAPALPSSLLLRTAWESRPHRGWCWAFP